MQIRREKLLQEEENSRCVGGAAAETGPGRDVLLYFDCNAATQARTFEERGRRTPGEVAFVARRMRGKRPGHREAEPLCRRDLDPVADIREHRDAVEEMIAVGALPRDVQREIDLCRREPRDAAGCVASGGFRRMLGGQGRILLEGAASISFSSAIFFRISSSSGPSAPKSRACRHWNCASSVGRPSSRHRQDGH